MSTIQADKILDDDVTSSDGDFSANAILRDDALLFTIAFKQPDNDWDDIHETVVPSNLDAGVSKRDIKHHAQMLANQLEHEFTSRHNPDLKKNEQTVRKKASEWLTEEGLDPSRSKSISSPDDQGDQNTITIDNITFDETAMDGFEKKPKGTIDFPNGYTASVIYDEQLDTYEVAVLRGDEIVNTDEFGRVARNQDESMVNEKLQLIQGFPDVRENQESNSNSSSRGISH